MTHWISEKLPNQLFGPTQKTWRLHEQMVLKPNWIYGTNEISTFFCNSAKNHFCQIPLLLSNMKNTLIFKVQKTTHIVHKFENLLKQILSLRGRDMWESCWKLRSNGKTFPLEKE